MNFYTVTLMKN